MTTTQQDALLDEKTLDALHKFFDHQPSAGELKQIQRAWTALFSALSSEGAQRLNSSFGLVKALAHGFIDPYTIKQLSGRIQRTIPMELDVCQKLTSILAHSIYPTQVTPEAKEFINGVKNPLNATSIRFKLVELVPLRPAEEVQQDKQNKIACCDAHLNILLDKMVQRFVGLRMSDAHTLLGFLCDKTYEPLVCKLLKYHDQLPSRPLRIVAAQRHGGDEFEILPAWVLTAEFTNNASGIQVKIDSKPIDHVLLSWETYVLMSHPK